MHSFVTIIDHLLPKQDYTVVIWVYRLVVISTKLLLIMAEYGIMNDATLDLVLLEKI